MPSSGVVPDIADSKLLENILAADLSPKTKTNYESCARALSAKAEKNIAHIMVHPEIYIPLIRKWYEKDTTYKVSLSFIMGIFKYNKQLQIDHASAFEKWGAAFKSADGAVNDRYESNAPTERQLQGYVPYDQIIKARDELPLVQSIASFLECIPTFVQCDVSMHESLFTKPSLQLLVIKTVKTKIAKRVKTAKKKSKTTILY